MSETYTFNSLDEGLRKIDIYKLHPSLLPFIGSKYDKYRIIQIGESHYINQTEQTEKYGIQYFNKWWVDTCDDMITNLDSKGWVDTRAVVSRYMNNDGTYSIFNNFVKSFSNVVLDQPITNITSEDKQLYEHFAFMNFFQMPSLYEGMKFWNSLVISANKAGNEQLAYDMWETTVIKSIQTLDDVIDVINPKVIVFTSISAGDAYKNNKGRYADDSRVIYTSHPSYPFTWQKPLKRFDGKTGKEYFEECLFKAFK